MDSDMDEAAKNNIRRDMQERITGAIGFDGNVTDEQQIAAVEALCMCASAVFAAATEMCPTEDVACGLADAALQGMVEFRRNWLRNN